MNVCLRIFHDITHDEECFDVVDIETGRRIAGPVSVAVTGSAAPQKWNETGHGYSAAALAKALHSLANMLE